MAFSAVFMSGLVLCVICIAFRPISAKSSLSEALSFSLSGTLPRCLCVRNSQNLASGGLCWTIKNPSVASISFPYREIQSSAWIISSVVEQGTYYIFPSSVWVIFKTTVPPMAAARAAAVRCGMFLLTTSCICFKSSARLTLVSSLRVSSSVDICSYYSESFTAVQLLLFTTVDTYCNYYFLL